MEDTILAVESEIAFCSSFIFKESPHGADKRPKTCWVVVAVRDPSENVFNDTNIAAGITSPQTHTLIRPKDMATTKNTNE